MELAWGPRTILLLLSERKRKENQATQTGEIKLVQVISTKNIMLSFFSILFCVFARGPEAWQSCGQNSRRIRKEKHFVTISDHPTKF